MDMSNYLQEKFDFLEGKMLFFRVKGGLPSTSIAMGEETSGAVWPPHKAASDSGFSEIDAYAMIF